MTSFIKKYLFNFGLLKLNKKRNAVVGIDITSSAVKLVELRKSSLGYHIENIAMVPIQFDKVDHQSTETYIIGQAIQKALTQSHSTAKQAIVAVGGASVITKSISIPAVLSEDEIMEQIIIDTPKHLQLSSNDINIDFIIQGVNEINTNLLDVLLVAARKESVEHKIAVLRHAQLKSKIIDVETFTIGNALSLLTSQLPYDIHDKTIAVVDIGANVTTLHVIHRSQSIYTRELAFGGKQLTSHIAQAYQLTLSEAELAKKQGDLPENYLSDLLEPFKQSIVEQIQRSIQLFSTSQRTHRIDSIILSGGCAAISGIDTLVSNTLNLPTYVANPFIDMTYSSHITQQYLNENSSSMLVACGLALRNFD
jgi:type IV pilus assembly protein PilM